MTEPVADEAVFSAQLNRKVMGAWLVVTLISTTLEAVSLIVGVGNIIDWILLIAFGSISAVIASHIFDKRAVLTVTSEGIHDRRISRNLIRWDDMVNHQMLVSGKIPTLGVWLSNAAEKKAGVYPWSIIYKNQYGPFGKTKGYRIWAHRTRAEGHEFTRAIQRFAPNRYD
ncbi:MAG: hypothetical protein ABJO09_02225 [Hyphomicrobiales bacterium]